MRKCSSTILYAACTFRPYKSTPVLKLFRTFTGKMTRGLSLRMIFSLLFQDTLLYIKRCCLKKNLNAPRPSEHPLGRGENVKTLALLLLLYCCNLKNRRPQQSKK